MRYLFTTLAVGDFYVKNAIDCYQNMISKTSMCDFNITTNQNIKNIDKINFDKFYLDKYESDLGGFSFYLSLKSLSLKYAITQGNYDYVIYTDADWRITENFSEKKILDLFDYMEKKQLDVLFERPAQLTLCNNG